MNASLFVRPPRLCHTDSLPTRRVLRILDLSVIFLVQKALPVCEIVRIVREKNSHGYSLSIDLFDGTVAGSIRKVRDPFVAYM